MGVRHIHEAQDGPTGLEMIRNQAPDVVILDWEMPGLNGASFVRMVRSPETFPLPDVPIIMLTGHGERARVIEAVCVGVNEFLLKPVSTNALRDRAHRRAVQSAPDGEQRPVLRTDAAQARDRDLCRQRPGHRQSGDAGLAVCPAPDGAPSTAPGCGRA